MAKTQYRYYGELFWQSMSGNAIIALTNAVGSGKTIKLHSLEVKSVAVGALTGVTTLGLVRGTAATGGDICLLSPMDSNSVLPSGVGVYKNIGFTPAAGASFIRVCAWQTSLATSPGFAQRFTPNSIKGGACSDFYANARKGYGVENIVLRVGESIALYPETLNSTRNQAFMVQYTIIVRGTPNRTWRGNAFVHANTNTAAIVITNNSASDIIEVKSLRTQYVGTVDTTYLQLVPVGSVQPAANEDLTRKVPVVKTDTIYEDLPSTIKLMQDVAILPFGVPEAYFSQASTGTPKGYNYLQTKDFIGPQYFVMFPEHTGQGLQGAASDSNLAPRASKNHNLISRGAPLVIRSGEGVALVSGAETAIVAAAVGTAGWQPIHIGLVFSIESSLSLTLTGVIPGSDIVVLQPGTDIEYSNIDSNSDTTYSFDYTPSITSVDICIYKQGYIPWTIRGLALSSFSSSIPVQQVIDRVYLN